VEIEAQGEVSKLELFLEMVGEGPALSQVTDIQFKDIPVLETERNFDIRYCS
jgi:acylphosphatase